MATASELGQIDGVPAGAAAVSGTACTTSTMRTLANNLNALADSRSRVLVSFPPLSTTTGGIGVKVGVASEWQRLYSFGPFPLLVGSDGLPYPIRARVGGRSDGVASSRLRIGACLPSSASIEMQATTIGANILETAAFTSATNAWRDPTVAKTTLTLDASFLATSLAIVDGVNSGSPGSVAAVMVVIEVWAFSAVAGAAFCTQAYAAEQVPL